MSTITPLVNIPPFGELSMYNKDNLTVNNKLYESCAKFIYSNMVDNTEDKVIILNSDDSNILEITNILLKKSTDKFVSIILDQLISTKMKDDEEFKNRLLNSADLPILYISKFEDPYLCVRPDGTGDNVYGLKLQQARYQYIQLEKKTSVLNKNKKLYRSYIVYQWLYELYRKGENIDVYRNLSIDDILKNNKEIEVNAIKQNVFFDLINNDKNLLKMLNMFISHEDLLIMKVMNFEETKKLLFNQTFKMKLILYDTYLKYIISNKFNLTNTQLTEAIRKFKNNKIDPVNRMNIIDTLYMRYINKTLNKELLSLIDYDIKDIYIPSDTDLRSSQKNNELIEGYKEDIKIVKIGKISREDILLTKLYDELNVNEEDRQSYDELNKNESIGLYNNIKIYFENKDNENNDKNSFLQKMIDSLRDHHERGVIKRQKYFIINDTEVNSPNEIFLLGYSRDFKIDNITYHTMYHYIVFRLISKITGISMNEVLQDLDKPQATIHILFEMYKNLYQQQKQQKLIDLAKVSFEEKFKIKNLQMLLITTGDLPIFINNEYEDNLFGQIMVDIRENLKIDYNKYSVYHDQLKNEEISEMMKNELMKKYVLSRMYDMLNTILFFKKFKNVSINMKNAKKIIESIYINCRNLTKQTFLLPDVIKQDIKHEYSIIEDEIIVYIFNEVMAIIQVVVNQATLRDKKINVLQIMDVLYSSQKLIEFDSCYYKVFYDEKMSNICSALLNIVKSINKKIDFQKITKNDINLAASILLNKDISFSISLSDIVVIKSKKSNKKTKIVEEDDDDEDDEDVVEDVEEENTTDEDEFIEYKDEEDEDENDEEGGVEGVEGDEEGGDEYGERNYSTKNEKNKYIKDFKNFLKNVLQIYSDDVDEILLYIIKITLLIKNYKYLNETVKNNRIKFFCNL